MVTSLSPGSLRRMLREEYVSYRLDYRPPHGVVEVTAGDERYFSFRYRGRTIRFYYDGTRGQRFDAFLSVVNGFYGSTWADSSGPLDFTGKVVLDVGVALGDTPICFILLGAKRVIGLEPQPALFATAVRNVRLNGLENEVTLLNEAAGISGTLTQTVDPWASGGTEITDSQGGFTVQSSSLGDLVNRYALEHAILKVDCEGCEYRFLNVTPSDLKPFDLVILEYHRGPDPLAERLSHAGFRVEVLDRRQVHNPSARSPLLECGLIIASRPGPSGGSD